MKFICCGECGRKFEDEDEVHLHCVKCWDELKKQNSIEDIKTGLKMGIEIVDNILFGLDSKLDSRPKTDIKKLTEKNQLLQAVADDGQAVINETGCGCPCCSRLKDSLAALREFEKGEK